MSTAGQFAEKALKDYISNVVSEKMLSRLESFADWAVQDAINNREYLSFTGNTVTSLTAGIYVGNQLNTIVSSHDKLSEPVHEKVQKGQSLHLEEPYEGWERWVKGSVNVSPGYGWQTAIDKLKKYNPKSKSLLSLVFVVGTEYATYIQDVRDLNVLEDTKISSTDKLKQILCQKIN